MNISKINTNTCSFGQVNISAAKRAINRAENLYELENIKSYVKSQKDNYACDIKATSTEQYKQGWIYEATVKKSGFKVYFTNLKDACRYADDQKDLAIKHNEHLQGYISKNQETASKIIDEITDEYNYM